MNPEHSSVSAYLALEDKTEGYSYLACQGDQPDETALLGVVMAAIHAYECGIPPTEIARAIREALASGIRFHGNVQSGGHDLAYWRAIRDEAEGSFRSSEADE
jgi:hypothetical protein